ncbi:MAG: LytTR family DNA-binding domain-containing protein [Muribaculaceae bacterium]|nr:LytTR family DNA-binding domain-containing protein [Muribaculaceae bacterium]
MTDSKIKCLVVDDEPLAAALISSYVSKTPFLELIAEVYDSEQALEIMRTSNVELVFMDIKMPHLSGMQLARLIPQNIRVIFTTAYSDHAVEGFRVNALDYLLKPISYEEFLQSAMRAQSTMSLVNSSTTAANGFLTVKSEYRLVRMPFSEIEYIEGLKDYVKIFLSDESKPVLSLMSMKGLEELLPASNFMRVHRSFIVNTDKVRIIERTSIIMRDKCIPVSESYRKAFMTKLGVE